MQEISSPPAQPPCPRARVARRMLLQPALRRVQLPLQIRLALVARLARAVDAAGGGGGAVRPTPVPRPRPQPHNARA